MTLTLTKNIITHMSSLFSFTSINNILSVLRSILVVQRIRPIVGAVHLLADGEYLLLSLSGGATGGHGGGAQSPPRFGEPPCCWLRISPKMLFLS